MAVDQNMRRQLEASLERLDLAAHAAGIGFWEWDLLSDRLSTDAHSATLYGLSTTGAPAKAQLARLVHPEDLTVFNAAIAAAIASGERAQQRFRVVLSDRSVLCT